MTKAGIGFRYYIHYTKTIGLHVIYMLLLSYTELWQCLFFIRFILEILFFSLVYQVNFNYYFTSIQSDSVCEPLFDSSVLMCRFVLF